MEIVQLILKTEKLHTHFYLTFVCTFYERDTTVFVFSSQITNFNGYFHWNSQYWLTISLLEGVIESYNWSRISLNLDLFARKTEIELHHYETIHEPKTNKKKWIEINKRFSLIIIDQLIPNRETKWNLFVELTQVHTKCGCQSYECGV